MYKRDADITIDTQNFCYFRDMANESRIAFNKMKENHEGKIDIQHYDCNGKNWIAFDKDGYAMLMMQYFPSVQQRNNLDDKIHFRSYAKIGTIKTITSRGKEIYYKAWIKCKKEDAYKIGV